MRWSVLLYQLLALGLETFAQDDVTAAPIIPQDCSLHCIRQGGPGCEYCRVSGSDIKEALGLNSISTFGGCVPWPCLALVGKEDPHICQHYVQAPTDVTVELVQDSNPTSDSVVISWKPSYYGIAFLRGFQVILQALGGSTVACQLLLFHRNLSLPVSHAERVYRSDPFHGLSLDSQYAVTVMALPVPEEWEKFYKNKIFSTRSCAEKNGLEACKKDWYPEQVKVQHDGIDISVTFNLAPEELGISSYFSLCYTSGMKTYTDIKPNYKQNKTHCTYHLKDLQEETNYTCEIAANEVDAVRRTFNVYVPRIHTDPVITPPPSLALVLPVCLAVLCVLLIMLAALIIRRRRSKEPKMKKHHINPDILKQHEDSTGQEEVVLLPGRRATPPRLLLCYSSRDGAAHVKAVLQLGAFIQQHMATQVCLDLWDSLSVAEEGSVVWHCRQIRESDFILVICSKGLNYRHQSPASGSQEEEEEAKMFGTFSSDAVVQLIREEVCQAKARGQDLSKYMAAIFEYSEETDIPTELRLVPHYTLTSDLPLLFSHLHSVALHQPGGYLKIGNMSEEGFSKLPAGAALQTAIHEAGTATKGQRRHSVDGVV